jgi:hypothetical protein
MVRKRTLHDKQMAKPRLGRLLASVLYCSLEHTRKKLLTKIILNRFRHQVKKSITKMYSFGRLLAMRFKLFYT